VGEADANYIYNGNEGSECLCMLYCPNGNTAATCGIQVPNILVEGPPVNVCRNYLHDHRLVWTNSNGTKTCFPIGKAELASTPINCNEMGNADYK
jgi:hypothetical protein